MTPKQEEIKAGVILKADKRPAMRVLLTTQDNLICIQEISPKVKQIPENIKWYTISSLLNMKGLEISDAPQDNPYEPANLRRSRLKKKKEDR